MTHTSGPASPRRSAHDVLAVLLDPASFSSWDVAPVPLEDNGGDNAGYAAELAAAAARAGTDEAVITGEGLLGDHRVAVIAGEFGFLAGSIGVAAATRIIAAFDRAREERLPLIALPSSGGTRMQEGTPAFVTMVGITRAVAAYKAAGLPYLTYLRHPTTGGVLASWGSLGQFTFGEPGATIGFLGARVYEALYGEAFPSGVQTAENLAEHGVIDAVLPLEEFVVVARRLLDLLESELESGSSSVPTESTAESAAGSSDAWDSVTRTRRADRPGVRDVLHAGAGEVVELSGTGAGERDPAILLAVKSFGGRACVVVGQDRSASEPLGPGGLRTARRGMRLAQELGLPLVTVVDTEGAALSQAAEEGALAGEIARCLEDLVTLDVPTVSVLLGQGTGGGALALLPAERVLAAQHGWVSPLPPEGASAILHRTPERAAELADQQQVCSAALLSHGIVDQIVPELPDAADEPVAFCERVSQAIAHALADPTNTAWADTVLTDTANTDWADTAKRDGTARPAARHTDS